MEVTAWIPQGGPKTCLRVSHFKAAMPLAIVFSHRNEGSLCLAVDFQRRGRWLTALPYARACLYYNGYLPQLFRFGIWTIEFYIVSQHRQYNILSRQMGIHHHLVLGKIKIDVILRVKFKPSLSINNHSQKALAHKVTYFIIHNMNNML